MKTYTAHTNYHTDTNSIIEKLKLADLVDEKEFSISEAWINIGGWQSWNPGFEVAPGKQQPSLTNRLIKPWNNYLVFPNTTFKPDKNLVLAQFITYLRWGDFYLVFASVGNVSRVLPPVQFIFDRRDNTITIEICDKGNDWRRDDITAQIEIFTASSFFECKDKLPCKVLAMLGMDAGSFPRRDASMGFTLLRRGSPLPYYIRSRIQEDQYIFLEAIQSVREHLLIFYHGQDDKNPDTSTAKLSPAPVVEELLAYAERACQLSDGGDVRKALVVARHLNSFDVANFRQRKESPEMLSLRSSFSFDQVGHAIAVTAEGAGSEAEAWKAYYALPMPKSVPADNGMLKVELADVERFFKSPVEKFLRSRLGFSDIEEEAVSLEDNERFGVANGLDGWKVKKNIFSEVLLSSAPGGAEKVLKHLRRTSQLPLGELAEQTFQVQKQQFKMIPEDHWSALYTTQQSEEFSLNLEVPNNLLSGCPELQKLRQEKCLLDGKKPVNAQIPVCLQGYFPVAKDGTNCVVFGECFGRTPEARHKFVPYLRWLMAMVARPEAQPLCQIVVPMKNDGKNVWTLKVPKKGLDGKAVLSKIVQLYLLGQVVPLPIMLNDYDNDAVELVFGSVETIKETPELKAAKEACEKLIVPERGTWS